MFETFRDISKSLTGLKAPLYLDQADIQIIDGGSNLSQHMNLRGLLIETYQIETFFRAERSGDFWTVSRTVVERAYNRMSPVEEKVADLTINQAAALLSGYIAQDKKFGTIHKPGKDDFEENKIISLKTLTEKIRKNQIVYRSDYVERFLAREKAKRSSADPTPGK